MGAKTTKFIKEIEGAALACGPLGAQLSEVNQQIKKNAKAGQDLYQAHAKRVGELEKQLGLRSGADDSRLERLLDGADPVIAQIDKDSAAIGLVTVKFRAEKAKIIADLKKYFAPFKAKLAEFESFILKKEKSSNPFKSKKSVPDAKKFIARMKALQNDMLAMATN